jgi:hypothetical protein
MQGIPIENHGTQSRFDQAAKTAEKGHGIGAQKTAIGKVEAHILKIVVDLIPYPEQPYEIGWVIVNRGHLDSLLRHA